MTLKHARLEYDDDEKNSHKFYEVVLDQVGEGQFRIETRWGRKPGFGRRPAVKSQTKGVVGDVINALVIFQDWIDKKQSKGYRLVFEG